MADSPSGGSALAALLRSWRERALLTQQQLAARSGLGVRTIRRLESDGLRRPRSDSVRLLADALDLSVAERAQLTAAARSAPALIGPPRQLPLPPQNFTGRAQELADLDQLGDSSTVVITAIDGMAGIGKTALAVHAAHRIAGRYPHGQLFTDLHGYTQGLDPIEPGEALDQLLRSLGVPGTQIPAGLDERAALYRTRLADQQMLVVLDNAATEAQVMPLLPGSTGSLVLVTSRRRLTGLDHTHTLSLNTLPTPDAVRLFIHTAGETRLAGQPAELVIETVELCGRLPLAIRIAAARLRSRLTWNLAHLVERLRDQRHRLVELAAGQRSVTAALDLSYQHLSRDQQCTYRLLGLHSGPDLDAYAAAALLDLPLGYARRRLDQLLDAHLLLEPVAGRYRFHDLTRAHAAHAATRDESGPARSAALDRLLDYYRHTASLAVDAAYPYEREHRPQVPPASTPNPDLPGPPSALGWLDTELPNLLATARYAMEHDRYEYIMHLSVLLDRYLRTRGRHHDAATLHDQALAAARATGDRVSEQSALAGLGWVHRLQGRYEPAADHLGRAIELTDAIGHRPGEVDALTGLGDVRWIQGRYEQATDHYQHALQIAHTTGNRPGEADALTGLGRVRWIQGRYEQAANQFQQALRLARTTGYRIGELNALRGLGQIHGIQGRHDQTADHYRQVLRLARAIGHRIGELDALTVLGHVHRMRGRYDQAADHYQQVLQLAHTTGNRIGELNALTGLGHLHRMQGRYDQAADHYQRAWQTAHITGNRGAELIALTGLGQLHRCQGRFEQAVADYQRLAQLARDGGDRNYQFEAWQGLGRLRQATGHPDAAIAHHERALGLASELGQADDQARAHDGLAHAHRALHQPEQARRHWQQALNILDRLGVDFTEDEEATVAAIRANLGRLDSRTGLPGSDPHPESVR